ncbi:glycosyltransferase family 1 protein [Flavobacterium sp. RSP49]|uniref:glycosyltransferase family 4 protein n=1 Tax=Flavobacterium sp. RSP49 TaxID=2497487 RepID=UPI000F82084D|nr:glycosyltransferase family 1 protein [Flavobacterium sp. RSP49]RTY99103.1 glycosyltransferase family 1 protein [Flavobacterium sp. RSP49]
MKITLDNIIYSNVTQGGVSNYWFELSKYLLENQEDQVSFYEEYNCKLNFHRQQLLIPENKIILNNSLIKSSIKRRLSPVEIKTKDYFLYHSSYYRPVTGSDFFSEITTLHDFTHNYYSSFIKRLVHNKMKYSAIKRSKGIICISGNTYQDLKKFCSPSKNQKVAIIYNGVSNDYYPIIEERYASEKYLNAIGIDDPYVLFVGGRINYKNFSFVIKLLKEIPAIKLVIVGPSLTRSELNLFDKETLKRTCVVSDVKNSELNILYNFAHALLYPSSYEGFGIPIIEAMKAGCPVLALQNSSIMEVSGEAAILFKELNIGLFKKALARLYESNFRKEITEKGFLQAEFFSWDKCCKETYEFYKEIY